MRIRTARVIDRDWQTAYRIFVPDKAPSEPPPFLTIEEEHELVRYMVNNDSPRIAAMFNELQFRRAEVNALRNRLARPWQAVRIVAAAGVGAITVVASVALLLLSMAALVDWIKA